MPKSFKTISKVLFYILTAFLIYVVIVLIHGTLTDFQPPEKQQISLPSAAAALPLTDSVLSFLTWNIGYGGLGAKSDFFYHGSGFFWPGDQMVHSPKKLVQQYTDGIAGFLKNQKADFYLLQEVDISSSRSYHLDEMKLIGEALQKPNAAYAPNYKVSRVPVPLLQPWHVYGQTESGLVTYSHAAPSVAWRYQLPGEYGWPNRIFQLDRCLLELRFPLANGKELVLFNVHNSPYVNDVALRKQQMEYLKNLVLDEYTEGNYIIAGGDWNQNPPFFKPDALLPLPVRANQAAQPAPDIFPPDWQWIYDPKTPTVRSTRSIYEKGKTEVSIIDFFLISPNLKALAVKGLDTDFQYSDHQPVWIEIELLP